MRITSTQTVQGDDKGNLEALHAAGYYTTTAAMTRYVALAGSDVTGDGTAGNPYATWARADADIPYRVQHACKILIDAADYAGGCPALASNHVFEDGGSLAIIGVGAPRHISGPHAVTGTTVLTTGVLRITVGAGGLGANDILCGQTVMVATGAHPGWARVVVANTDTTMDVTYVSDKVENGDTVTLVNPAVRIAATNLFLHYQPAGAVRHDPGDFAKLDSRLLVHNVWLDFTAATSIYEIIRLHGRHDTEGPIFDFVRVDLPSPMYGAITVEDYALGASGTFVQRTYKADGGTGITNGDGPNGVGLTLVSAGDRTERVLYGYGNVYMNNVACKGALYLNDGSLSVHYCGIGTVESYGPGGLNLYYSHLQGKAGSYGIYADHADIDGYYLYFEYGTYAIVLRTAGTLRLDHCVCSNTHITASAVNIGAGGRVHQDGALGSFLGATVAQAAYIFTAPAVDVKGATWMAANGTGATDALGAFVIRQD